MPLFRLLPFVLAALVLGVLVATEAGTRMRPLTRVAGTIQRHPSFQNILLVIFSLTVALGTLEIGATVASSLGLLQYKSPMQTLLPKGTEDWRRAHITADHLRQPDPILWWRSIAAPPYNRQGFRGREAQIPKPPSTVRIIAYGDSNTDGPARGGGWTEKLQVLLDTYGADRGMSYEVLNAGVAGYSSHQGLLRFRQEVETYEPDIILVSFGWNDLASALGKPDGAYVPPPPLMVAVERTLLRFKFYLVAKHYAQKIQTQPEPTTGHRVPLDDYRDNLRQFYALSTSHQVESVFLTRPHRLPVEKIRALAPNWRNRVPEYNEVLMSLTRELGTHAIDVQNFFEQHDPSLFVDLSHFGEQGHQMMAQLLFERLHQFGLI